MNPAPRPFFQILRELLEEDGTVSLQELLEHGGAERIYGLALLLFALASFIPGIANGVGLAIAVVGVQMVWGRPYPWIPGRILRYKVHRGRVKEGLARMEGWMLRLGTRREPPHPLPQRLLGVLVVWTALLLSLPLILPFSNVLPAASLALLGLALLEDWAYPAWLGLLGGIAATVYFGVFFDLVMKALRGTWHWISHLLHAGMIS
ncbi:MAG TPA: exopolysaccharide biosynthesis protein [Holophagaceae bacterium]|nr:exopolysaccharide biosynthesis protein [Holophagaceae bacterium]